MTTDPTNTELADIAQDALALGQLIVDFARVQRITHHDDGRPENDAEHSFMLALMAGHLAHTYQPELEVAKVVQFALVHDLVELVTGDVNTLGASEALLHDKAAREEVALEQLGERLAVWPWLSELVTQYERLDTPEARFVKVVDKLTPVVFRVRNDAADLKAKGWKSRAEVREAVKAVTAKLHRVAGDQAFALSLREAMLDHQADLIESWSDAFPKP